ncbi:MAG: hypothetical protein ACXVZ4_08600 [Gaiellaceae bacterium]
MQEPHERDDHHPSRLIRTLLVAAAAALACAAAARAERLVSLPSPIAGLSPEPPLHGGAFASAENVRHRIDSRTVVRVSLDRSGAPFAVGATQRLDVRVQGDYFFTIGAPVLDVRPAAGSASVPGLRTGSILWAGFDPGRRMLAAAATLEPARAAQALPVRIRVGGGAVVLQNTTRVSIGTYSVAAPRGPVLAYLARLRSDVVHGRLPQPASVPVTSNPVPERMTVTAPLHVTGTLGARRVDLVLLDRVTLTAHGRIDLRVEPLERVETAGLVRLGGSALVRAAIRATLTLARTRQYDAYLGNPDPTGPSTTTYVYRSATRAAAPAAAAPAGGHGRSWRWDALLAAALALALVGGTALWARS